MDKDQEIGALIEKLARSIQSTIWNLQNMMDDLKRLGVAIARLKSSRKEEETEKNKDT